MGLGFHKAMFFYLDDSIGEKLFPVKVRMYEYSCENQIYENLLKKKNLQIKPEIIFEQKKILNDGKNQDLEEYQDSLIEDFVNRRGKYFSGDDLSWIHELNRNSDDYFKTDECDYFFDFERGHLKIVDKEHNIYACVSAKRILKMRQVYHKSEDSFKSAKKRIYYKGIYVTEYDFEMDLDMLEYIDFKGNLERNHIGINRAEFTNAGEKYICEEIYPKILRYMHIAIEDYARRGKIAKLVKRINENALLKEDSNCSAELIHSRVLFLIGMVAIVRARECVTYLFPMSQEEKKANNKQ